MADSERPSVKVSSEVEFQTQLQNKLTKNTCPNTEDPVKKSQEVKDTLQETTAEVAGFTTRRNQVGLLRMILKSKGHLITKDSAMNIYLPTQMIKKAEVD